MWMGAPKFVRLELLINSYITEFQTPQQFEVFVFSPVFEHQQFICKALFSGQQL